MGLEYKLKHFYTDFIVKEASAILDKGSGEYTYATLEKSGITTFEALQLLATHFQIDPMYIDAAGLKDEDAITQQTISLYSVVSTATRITLADNCWLALSDPLFFSDKPLVKGSLFGNFFWITIRNVQPKLSHAVQLASEPFGYFKQNFVNYFGHQRFGSPGSKYRTDEIGLRLVSGQIKEAAQILYEESVEIMKNHFNLPSEQKRFVELINKGASLDAAFSVIHPRMQAFYISSYYSRIWNELLAQKVRETGRGVELHSEMGIYSGNYFGIANAEALENFPGALPLEAATYVHQTKKIEIGKTYRNSFISTKFFLLESRPDEEFPGKYLLKVHFYLPSGCYGTAAIHQMLSAIANNEALSI